MRSSDLKDKPLLEVLSKFVYFFKPETGFPMITGAEISAGAGLAGPSTPNMRIGPLKQTRQRSLDTPIVYSDRSRCRAPSDKGVDPVIKITTLHIRRRAYPLRS